MSILSVQSGFSCNWKGRNRSNKIIPKKTGYIEYHTSTGLNVVLSAPHDGYMQPQEIQDRDAGCWVDSGCVWSHECGEKDYERCSAVVVRDWYTSDITRDLRLALCHRMSVCPAAIINLLHRNKVDANRAVDEATFEDPLATDVYNEFQRYIELEKGNINGTGLYIDLHGHGHTFQAAEIGYLISSSDLNSIETPEYTNTSIRSLAEKNQRRF